VLKRSYLMLTMLFSFTALSSALAGQTFTLPCIADAAMNGHSSERDLNWGADARMRLKDYQGIPFLQFDFSPVRGMAAVSCTLFVRSVDGQFAFCTDIISTIAASWYEGTSNGSYQDGASTFTRRVWPDTLWAGEGSDARSVINGDNGSLVNSSNICFPEGGGWAQVEIDQALAQQLIDSRAHGLALFGKDIQYNRDIYSREQYASEPYLVIEVTEGESVAPDGVSDLAVAESIYHGRFTLSWTAPGDDGSTGTAFAYEFRRSESPITDESSWESAEILLEPPEPDTAGTKQLWEVTSLTPGGSYYLAMRARDEAFNWSGISNQVRVTVPLDETPPARVEDLSAVPGSGSGEVILNWTAPGDDGSTGRAVSYQLRYFSQPIEESNWDQASVFPILLTPDTAGTSQSYLVSGLTEGVNYYFAIRACDEVPLAGPVSNSPAAAASSASYSVWAAPSYYKINPRTGNAFEYDQDSYDRPQASAPYRQYSRIWDASLARVRLLAGRNEFVGFQVVVEKTGQDTLKGVDLAVSDLSGPVTIESENVRLYREWYHRFDGIMYPDLLVPFKTGGSSFQVRPFSIPDPQITTFQGIEQNNQAVFVDVYIPHHAVAGNYTGTVTITAEGQLSREIALEVRVLDFELSDRTHYGTEFNCYGDIGPGWKISHTWDTAALHDSLERVVQRSLHEHRVYMNRMPYSHNPASQASFRCAPELSSGVGESLTISDWTEYDKRFGPYFDGSAFTGNPRSGVPIPFYYLPFHTEWPVRMPVPRDTTVFHDQNYIAGWTKIVTEFERHINERGWRLTGFFCYQNEKEHFGYVPWDLDEPTRPGDYRALNFFAGMFHQGLVGDGAAKMLYRCDMGHFSYMQGELDEAVDIWVINRGDYPESRVRQRITAGDIAWTYGDAPMIYESMAENYYDFFSNWARGARGYCYWDTFQAWSGDAWNDNHDGSTNIFYPGMAGYTDMVGHVVCPSLRLKAIRDCTELMEALHLMANSSWFTTEQSESFAGRFSDKQIETYASAEQELKMLIDGLGAGTPDPPLPDEKICDFSGDGAVSLHDVIAFLLLARHDPANPSLDLNRDGAYSIADALRLLFDILNGNCPEGTSMLASAATDPDREMIRGLSEHELVYLETALERMNLTGEQKAAFEILLYGGSAQAELPKAFALSRNMPNPFNPSTTISYTVPENENIRVTLEVFNMRGMRLRKLVDEERGPGVYSVIWDGTDEKGARVSSGVYFYRLRAGDFVKVRKMVLIK